MNITQYYHINKLNVRPFIYIAWRNFRKQKPDVEENLQFFEIEENTGEQNLRLIEDLHVQSKIINNHRQYITDTRLV